MKSIYLFVTILSLASISSLCNSAPTNTIVKFNNNTCDENICGAVALACLLDCDCDLTTSECLSTCENCLDLLYDECCGCFNVCDYKKISTLSPMIIEYNEENKIKSPSKYTSYSFVDNYEFEFEFEFNPIIINKTENSMCITNPSGNYCNFGSGCNTCASVCRNHGYSWYCCYGSSCCCYKESTMCNTAPSCPMNYC